MYCGNVRLSGPLVGINDGGLLADSAAGDAGCLERVGDENGDDDGDEDGDTVGDSVDEMG